MPSLNRVYLMGNVTRDPECRQTASGTSVTDLRLAVSESYKNRAGETVETVCYIDVNAWGRQAETCAEYLAKGSPILVEGRLTLDEWEKDGQKHSKVRVRADRVQFLRGKQSPGGGFPGAPEGLEIPSSTASVDEWDKCPL